jgi:hypothetical protein
VFVCLDRAVNINSCWFGVRKFRSGISIVISIWVASAYVLIPILLFNQKLQLESYGGYLCVSTDESVTLFWLGTYPRRVLDFIDIVFRILFPIALICAELASAWPDRGGLYNWILESLGPRMAFLVVWWSWMAAIVTILVNLTFLTLTLGYTIAPAYAHQQAFVLSVSFLVLFFGNQYLSIVFFRYFFRPEYRKKIILS